jgi:hypothetical protein
MKTSFKLFAISLFTLFSIMATNVSRAQVSASVSFSVFHDNLRAYGRWVNHPRYGQVWISNERGFRPYSTGGHWAYTDYGWTWVSDYPWGWATFHYGRWDYDPEYGWVWIPGYEWGPAWVSWRTSGDYYGWAPLGPNVNISIGISFGNTIPEDRWVFVPHRYIMSPAVNRYYMPRTKNVTIIRNTTIINNTRETNISNKRVVVVGGPKREDVERVTHTRVETMHVNNSSRPGTPTVDRSKNTINIYRPVVNNTTVNKTTVNNNKEVNKTTVNNNNKAVNKTTVNNNKAVNKTTVNNNKEANKTAVNNNKTVTKTNKEVQKKAPVNNNANNQNTRKQTENKKPIEKKPAPKPNTDNKNNEPKKPQASVNPSNNNNDQKANALNKTESKTAKSKIETKRETSDTVAKNNHRKPKQNDQQK